MYYYVILFPVLKSCSRAGVDLKTLRIDFVESILDVLENYVCVKVPV